MTQVAVNKCHDGKQVPGTLLEKAEKLSCAIRDKAFSLFEKRNGNGHGSALEDWLAAEREVVWVPDAELVDTGKELRVKMAVPGFAAKEVEVSVTPEDLVVRADANHTHKEEEANVAFCEFGNRTLFRRLALPGRIDVDKVSATLDNGILMVTAPRPVAA